MSEHCGLNHTRVWAPLALATAIVLSAAAPASADHSITIPASDNGCAVDLHAEATHGSGRARIGYGDITFTNLETGGTYLQRSRYTETSTFEPSTGLTQVRIVGSIWLGLWPGDMGPSGVVQEPGLEILVSGRVQLTYNEEFVYTAFSLDGTYQDLCALLTD